MLGGGAELFPLVGEIPAPLKDRFSRSPELHLACTSQSSSDLTIVQETFLSLGFSAELFAWLPFC